MGSADGWLVLYHGARYTAAGSLYRVGVPLFEREPMDSCIARAELVDHGSNGRGRLA